MEKIETVRDFLVATRDVIADPEHWTQGTWARDADGESVDAFSPDAVRWCAVGAMEKVERTIGKVDPDSELSGFILWGKSRKYLRKTVSELNIEKVGSSIHMYNDSHSHDDVLRVLDQAIEKEGV